ncbi:olfactory receptor 14A16-like [Lagopus leucura]|uniref:olfactory receptor 14A16-like n=1 Tax=Lagopus leucura TaxID=30410 RepID=UPI001C66F462|nr:olfactory receptor 14A16-like [Lagopus leucura]
MSNSTSTTEFLLLAFTDTCLCMTSMHLQELRLLHFWLSLGIYLAALLGNGLVIMAVVCDHHMHTPMYFFLLNLAFCDLGSISTTLPKAMSNFLWGSGAISYTGCAAQVFFLFFCTTAECALLTVMSYDRYIAICKPLHYGTLLGSRACATMAAAAWGSGVLNALLHAASTFSLPLCQGNAVDQFFCEVPQILKLSCSSSYLREVALLVVSLSSASGCLVFIVLSYVQIFRAAVRMPSEQGWHKAFSTCLPHLAVVSLFVSTGTFAYLKPPSISFPSLDLAVAVLYSVVSPAVNPHLQSSSIIYSMRNRELRGALKKQMSRLFRSRHLSFFFCRSFIVKLLIVRTCRLLMLVFFPFGFL